MTSWHVDAKIRLKTATFDFAKGVWEVEAYINFNAPHSNEDIVSTSATHKWSMFGDDFAALEKILEDKVGKDLLGPQKTLEALQKDYA
jgi:hypothetical protein